MSMNDLNNAQAGELPGWVRMQEKTFRRWANQFLSERMMVIEEDPKTKMGLDNQLSDGIKLCTLLEVISSKSLPLGSKNPKSKFQKMENLNNALNFIKREGLVLVGIGAEDIHDGKLKLILGMIWTLILRFQINLGDGSPKWELLQWVRQQVKPYAVDEPNNFTKDWQNGKIMAALVDSIQPGIMTPHDLSGMTGDASQDLERSFQTALDEYEIPRILDVIDVVQEPEELSMMTYVSYFREYVNNDGRRKKEELLRKKRTADPAFCFAEGPGLEKAETYQQAEFTIHARNCFNEELDPKHGGDNFKVEIKDANGKVTQGAVKDNGDGNYPVTYIAPGTPGPLVINVTLDGTPIKDMPVTINNQGPDAGHCKASGPGVEGGRAKHDAPFTIESFDASGARCTSGGDKFAANVSGIGAVPVKDNGDGSFSGVYKVDKPGRVKVDITLDGKPIANSPFDVLFELGNAAQSYAEGPGLEAAQEDTPAVFTIFAVDADGQRAAEGGDPFKVDVNGPKGPVKVNVKDNGDGTYGVEYTPTGTGKHDINVTLHGDAIKDMPKSVDVRSTPDKSKSYIDGPFLEGVPQATKEQTFFVHALDKAGNPIPAERDLADFAIDVAGPNGPVAIDVQPDGDALKVTFTPEEPGKYTASAKFRDAHVKNSPASVTVKPAANAANSYCEGSGLGPNVVDNETYDFTVFVVDPAGKRRTDGGDDVKVTFGSAPIPVEPTVVDNGDGTYKVTYAPEEAGEYQFNVTVEGGDVKDSPFTVKCVEGVDADNSGFGKFSCTVTARDKKGNPLTFGGATFTSEWTKPEGADFEENLVDNNDGTYTIFYELRTVGKYVLVLKLNGKQIKSPIRIKID